MAAYFRSLFCLSGSATLSINIVQTCSEKRFWRKVGSFLEQKHHGQQDCIACGVVIEIKL